MAELVVAFHCLYRAEKIPEADFLALDVCWIEQPFGNWQVDGLLRVARLSRSQFQLDLDLDLVQEVVFTGRSAYLSSNVLAWMSASPSG